MKRTSWFTTLGLLQNSSVRSGWCAGCDDELPPTAPCAFASQLISSSCCMQDVLTCPPPLSVATYGNIRRCIRICRRTHAAPPSEADKSIRLINILFHTHLAPYVTHISTLQALGREPRYDTPTPLMHRKRMCTSGREER